jgi:DNA mismatch repair protein MutS
MAGKSTYLRQAALIVLLAQIGSFVPATRATIGVCDRIFTRVGAHDELARGLSTFMVEMVETAHILAHATAHSLLVFDEVGRGTSTYDGVSIAQALLEYLHDAPQLRSLTLFATHFHELTALVDRLPRLRNFRMEVREDGDQVIFLHQVIAGGADRSYGIHVAQLAGLPRQVVLRARAILGELEGQRPLERPPPSDQLSLPLPHPLVAELQQLDLEHLTPREALEKLFAWQGAHARG